MPSVLKIHSWGITSLPMWCMSRNRKERLKLNLILCLSLYRRPWEKTTHEERNAGKAMGSTTIGRQETRQRVRGRKGKIPWLCTDGRKMKRIGASTIVVSWTILHQLTYHTSQHGQSDQGMKTVLCWNSMMDHIQGEWQIEGFSTSS